MAKIGTSDSQRKDLQSNNPMEDRYELEKGDNLFRLIQGPQKSSSVFIPVLIERDGKYEESFSVVNFKDTPSIIDSLYTTEMEMRKTLGEEKPDYAFKPTTSYYYLAVKLNAPETKVKPLKLTKKSKDRILELESKLDLKDPSYLMNGLMWMFDINFIKSVDASKPARYGTSYSADIYGNNKFAGVIPADWIGQPADEIITEIGEGDFNTGMITVFGEELVDAINECEIDLEEVLKPMSESEIIEKLQKYPINFAAVNSNTGKNKFPQTQEFLEALESLGLTVITDFESGKTSTKATPPAETKAPKGGLVFKKSEKPKVEEAEVVAEVVDDTETKTESKPKRSTKLRTLKLGK